MLAGLRATSTHLHGHKYCNWHLHSCANSIPRHKPALNLQHRPAAVPAGGLDTAPGQRAHSSLDQAEVSTSARDWHAVDAPLLWQGSEEDANAADTPAALLPPPWKVMVLSDGSVTRHLQLLTGQAVSVECLQMEKLQGPPVALPSGGEQIPGPLLQRQVLLRTQDESHTPFVYAASWWAAASVDEYLQDVNQPIWVSLSKGHVELYREIQQVYCGQNKELERLLETPGPFWGRHYIFWHKGKPLTIIYEVFSNKLQQYLGPLPHQLQQLTAVEAAT